LLSQTVKCKMQHRIGILQFGQFDWLCRWVGRWFYGGASWRRSKNWILVWIGSFWFYVVVN